MSTEQEVAPDPVMLAYVRAPARPGMRMLALDDLPIVDWHRVPDDLDRQWPVALVASQAADLVEGRLEGAHAEVICELCGTMLGQRITWTGRPAVIGLVRGRRWSRARAWGRPPKSAVLAARHRAQWFCLLDHPHTPAHLPLYCRNHGAMSVASSLVRTAPRGVPLAVMPPGMEI